MEALLSADPVALQVTDASHASAARIAVQRVAHSLEFGETGVGKVSIVATEAVSNMLKHAGGGTFVARSHRPGRSFFALVSRGAAVQPGYTQRSRRGSSVGRAHG